MTPGQSSTPSLGDSGDARGHLYAPATKKFTEYYRDGKLTDGYAPFCKGERVRMKSFNWVQRTPLKKPRRHPMMRALEVSAMYEFKPIDPDYRPTRTLSELSAEHPDWAGLKQLASAEAIENPPPQLEGLSAALWRKTTSEQR